MTVTGRTRLLTIGLSAMLAVGVLGAGAAIAQDGGEGSNPSAQGEHKGHGHHKILKNTLRSIYDNAGLPAGTFKQGFKDGKSINQVLTENGVDPASVEAAVLADLDAQLDALVASGELDATKAAEIFAAAEERLPRLMDRVPDPERRGKPGAKLLNGIKGFIGSAAEALGMEPRELGQRMKAGETIEDIAIAQGVPVDAVIDAMVGDANARIDQAAANGNLDQGQVAEAKAKIAERIETFVTEGLQHNR